ncbi:MAG: aromatic amino acid lyase [Pseudomonadota bacterium]
MDDRTAAPIALSGRGLTVRALAAIAAGRPVAIVPGGLDAMARARAVIDEAVRERRPVYGVTTGLGPKATEALDEEEIAAFALRTVRGRAHAAGPDLPAETCRAILAVRLNTLLIGAAGARPALAEAMADQLAAGIAPAIRRTGSIGAADLVQGGEFGLSMIGEGRAWDAAGRLRPTAEVLAETGVAPYAPGPREGLALVSHSSVTAAVSALAVAGAEAAYARLQRVAALSMEGFRASLTPLDPDLLSLRPQAGQTAAAAELRELLEGSALWAPGASRRLQDPLSIRNLPQIHGALRAALGAARDAAEAEMNGASDNPAVLAERGEVLSTGAYLSLHLALTMGALGQALSHAAAAAASRAGKLLSGRFSGLPDGLNRHGAAGAGMAALMKTAEALWAEVAHAAASAPIHPGFSADGLEDVSVHGLRAAYGVEAALAPLARLAAVEALVAAEAVERRSLGEGLAPALRPLVETVRRAAAPFVEDRAFGEEIEALAEAMEAER